MRIIAIFSLSVALLSLGGCGKGDAEKGVTSQSETSMEYVERVLKGMGVEEGYDRIAERIVAIGTHGIALKGNQPDDALDIVEEYDFNDDVGDDFQTRRFKTMWKAYANGLAEIAETFGAAVNTGGEGDEKTAKSLVSISLNGVVTITSAESYSAQDDEYYEVSVAVCQSKAAEERLRDLNSGKSKPGKYSIAEWIEMQASTGMICPRSYCDNEGVWWRVAGVPVAFEAGRNSKKVATALEVAKHYAYEAALRTVAVGVSAFRGQSKPFVKGESDNDDVVHEKKVRVVKIKPLDALLPIDSQQIKWFELDKESPLDGKLVRCVIAAIPSGNKVADK